jgi:cell division protein FtsZ
MPEIKPEIETFAKIKVIGVGGSGGAAINRMVKSKIRGVEFISANTDVQALHFSEAPMKLHIGKTITRGLGAGMDPEVGRRAAEESQNEIRDILKGADMVFVTCGLGGGTGTGAAPIVAQIARDLGALTVAVVTKPFSFEGAQRRAIADQGLEELEDKVDTLITIPNDRLLQIIDKKTSLLDAFTTCDEILKNGVQGISELITIPGLINVDFADVKAIMKDAGSAMMGIGEASGEKRAEEAAKAAISSPLLELSIDGARGILFTVTGGTNLGMHEVAEAAKIITSSADPDAKVIFGAVINENLKDAVKVTVIAAGFNERRKAAYEETPPVHAFSMPVPPKTKGGERTAVGQFQKRPVKKIADFGDVDSAFDKDSVKKDASSKKPGAPGDKEGEDLDIPAFLRKKIM